MAVCSFFGHRDTPDSAAPLLRAAVEHMIVGVGVDKFYVGNQRRFDRMVRAVLREMKAVHPRVDYAVVLAYMPSERMNRAEDFSDTIFSEAVDGVMPKYAIDRRNRWMIDESDFIITYATGVSGGAAACKAIAEKKGKKVYNLPEYTEKPAPFNKKGRAYLRSISSRG